MTEGVPEPFLIGVYGLDVTEEAVRILRDTQAAGIYLQRRNIDSPEQVRTLLSNLESEAGRRLLVAIRHEGGRMTPFTRGVTFFPGNPAIARTGSTALARDVARVSGRELLSLGIDLNLAPLLDLETGAEDLQLRSFGADPAVTGTMGAEMVRGYRDAGILPAVGRFTGKDGTLEPFRQAIAAEVPVVCVSGEAMVSSKAVTEILRGSMAFQGVVMTDDLSSVPMEDAAVQALQAGCDLCLIANDYEVARRAARAVKGIEVRAESRARLNRLLSRRPPPPSEGDEGESNATLAATVAAGAVTVERDPQNALPIGTGRRVGILVPRLKDTADTVTIDDELRDTPSLLQEWTKGAAAKVQVLEVPMEADEGMLAMVVDWASHLDTVVLLCFDATHAPGQRRLLQALEAGAERVVAVMVGNPADRTLAGPLTAVVQSYGFRVCQLAAAIHRLFPRP